MFSTTIMSFAIAAIFAMNGVMAALPTSYTPPVTPTDSTYGLCAYPLTDAAAASPQAVVDYMNDHAGCNSVAGGSAVPAGVITGRKCGGPGPEIITDGVPGWAINSVFNQAACPPGSKCLKFKA